MNPPLFIVFLPLSILSLPRFIEVLPTVHLCHTYWYILFEQYITNLLQWSTTRCILLFFPYILFLFPVNYFPYRLFSNYECPSLSSINFYSHDNTFQITFRTKYLPYQNQITPQLWILPLHHFSWIGYHQNNIVFPFFARQSTSPPPE